MAATAPLTRAAKRRLLGSAAADPAAGAHARNGAAFEEMPDALFECIFARLPADARARCACVCRAWRWRLQRSPDAWRVWVDLDLSASAGVTCARTDAALAGATALARGRVASIKLFDFDCATLESDAPSSFSWAAIARVVRRNAGLRTLAFAPEDDNEWVQLPAVDHVILSAPALRELLVDVATMSTATATTMLESKSVYGALRLQQLKGMQRFSVALLKCPSLYGLHIHYADLEPQESVDALFGALYARGLFSVTFVHCRFAAETALPALAALIAAGNTKYFSFFNCTTLLHGAQEEHVDALCDAVGRSATLRELCLADVGARDAELTYLGVALRRAMRTAHRPPHATRPRLVLY